MFFQEFYGVKSYSQVSTLFWVELRAGCTTEVPFVRPLWTPIFPNTLYWPDCPVPMLRSWLPCWRFPLTRQCISGVSAHFRQFRSHFYVPSMLFWFLQLCHPIWNQDVCCFHFVLLAQDCFGLWDLLCFRMHFGILPFLSTWKILWDFDKNCIESVNASECGHFLPIH